MSNQLTKFDIDRLLDSVDIWESYSSLILQSHDAMRLMYTDPKQLAEFDAATVDRKQQLIREVATKRDQAIILKYKLVRIKEGIDAGMALEKLSKIGETNGPGEIG